MSPKRDCSLYFASTHRFHKVEDRIFELADLRAGNVRDQIVRATYLARSVVREVLSDKSAPVLILGGGAAGVSCAIAALREGATVWLLEAEPQLFATQMATSSRTIDPGEFDWPLAHWDLGTIPDDAGDGFALAYRRGIAADVAAAWLMVADDHEDTFGDRFTVVHNFDARTLTWKRTPTGVAVVGLSAHGRDAPEFGAVISCIGFGDEVVFDRSKRWNYRGLKFWATDTLHVNRLGFDQSGSNELHALVSGGGDGAQQDILRILTGHFGRDLVEALCRYSGDDAGFAQHFAGIGQACLKIDGLVWDSVEWSSHKEPKLKNVEKWHSDYEAMVDQLWASLTDAEIEWQCQTVIRPEVLRGKLSLTWILRTNCPSVCYPLNRFLTAWVLRLYARISSRPRLGLPGVQPSGGDAIIVTGYEIARVVPSQKSHDCSDRRNCFAQGHHVYLSPVGSTKSFLFSEFHEIVLRHGVSPNPMFKRSAKKLMLRSSDMVYIRT